MGNGRWRCAECRTDRRVTVGTLFQDSHLSLKTWLYAVWWITAQKTGVSALGLQGILGLGSYRTAWLMLHKIRKAMVRVDRTLLNTEVEVDETLLGGIISKKRGRDRESKMLVVIAAEIDGKKIGRIRMKHISDASTTMLHSFITDHVEKGTLIHTDGWTGYFGLEDKGFLHDRVWGDAVSVDDVLPHIHLVISLFKRWLLGTHQGKVNRKYLDNYLEEFTFRFNRRTSKARGLLFYRVLENVVVTQPNTYKQITMRKK
jgi:transposase-like protein